MTRLRLVFAAALAFGIAAESNPVQWFAGEGAISSAAAVIGRPATPGSYAGVARRTTRRVIRRSTIYVSTLPAGCSSITVNGAVVQQCGSTYYQPSGSQYVVVYID